MCSTHALQFFLLRTMTAAATTTPIIISLVKKEENNRAARLAHISAHTLSRDFAETRHELTKIQRGFDDNENIQMWP